MADIPKLLAALSPAQRRIVTDPARYRQVIAAAGSGKTRTVIALVEYAVRTGELTAQEVLLLSFSRRAVGEVRSRLAPGLREGVEVSTFHAFCFRHLAALVPESERCYSVLDEETRDSFLRDRLRAEGPALAGMPFELLLRRPDIFRREFPESSMRVFRALAEHKRRHALLEYEDLIARMLLELRRGSDAARSLRERYRLIVVDEFQDTDPAQLKFLKLMDPTRLVVVGDDWQAIYGFRGADVRPFLDFRRHFPGARQLRLADNYRSTGDIVRLGSRLIAASSRQLRKRVRATRNGRRRRPFACAVTPRQEVEVAQALAAHPSATLLVRSNFRRRHWIRAGLPEERVLTIHAAKGLEFPEVFLDLCAGWSGRGSSSINFDEEVRVAYVGVTRAMDFLCVLHRDDYATDDPAGRIFRAARDGLRTVPASRLFAELAAAPGAA